MACTLYIDSGVCFPLSVAFQVGEDAMENSKRQNCYSQSTSPKYSGCRRGSFFSIMYTRHKTGKFDMTKGKSSPPITHHGICDDVASGTETSTGLAPRSRHPQERSVPSQCPIALPSDMSIICRRCSFCFAAKQSTSLPAKRNPKYQRSPPHNNINTRCLVINYK